MHILKIHALVYVEILHCDLLWQSLSFWTALLERLLTCEQWTLFVDVCFNCVVWYECGRWCSQDDRPLALPEYRGWEAPAALLKVFHFLQSQSLLGFALWWQSLSTLRVRVSGKSFDYSLFPRIWVYLSAICSVSFLCCVTALING